MGQSCAVCAQERWFLAHVHRLQGLNRLTVKNGWPLPRIEDLLDMLAHANVFTSLDLAKGYHQFAVHPDDVPKTAFKSIWFV